MTSSLLTAEAPDPADTAQQALTCAALKQGLDPTGAELIYDAHNRVFRLPRVNVIGKVYHPSTRYSEAARQVRVARALLARGILTAASVGRSIMVHGHAVSFSRDLGSERPSDSQYATALRRLHHLPPTGIDFNPKNKIAYTFGQFYTLPPGAVCDTDRIRLHRFLAGAVDAYRQVSRPEYGLVHGDITPSTPSSPTGAPRSSTGSTSPSATSPSTRPPPGSRSTPSAKSFASTRSGWRRTATTSPPRTPSGTSCWCPSWAPARPSTTSPGACGAPRPAPRRSTASTPS
ncbi:hypothetical protein ACFQ2M_06830 [Kitasatospora saccharophila]|uniref:hypothetical protein n=1 Tax=Kitasatospora saccharophila TaxID=407973 RepID=UPI00362F9127